MWSDNMDVMSRPARGRGPHLTQQHIRHSHPTPSTATRASDGRLQDYAAMVAEGKDALRTSKTDLSGLAVHVQTS